MKRDFLLFVTVFVISIILIQLILFFSISSNQNNSNLFKAEVTNASFSFCLNYPSNINLSDCPIVINQSTSREDNAVICTINASHPLGNNVSIHPIFVFGGMNFTLSNNGSVFINATQTSVGFHSFIVRASDVSDCPFTTEEVFEFEIVDINDPPFLIRPINNVVLDEGSTRQHGILNSFFDDVDVLPQFGKPLIYSYNAIGPLRVNISISNSTSMLSITSPQGNCETDLVEFIATDQGNLSVKSNVIQIESRCRDEEEQTQGPQDPGALPNICDPRWDCDDWGECFINGTQMRECVDRARCDPFNFRRVYWQECEYIATCFDGIQNCHVMPDGSILCEEGVDCGGPCEPCFLEDDLDDVAATCFDGIQNCHVMPDGSILCEEGVDCGGPCEPCRRIETPGLIVDEGANNLIIIMAAVFVLVSILIAAYLVFRKQILSFFAKISWWLTRKKRKQFLLLDEDKVVFLNEINQVYSDIMKSSAQVFNRKDNELNDAVTISRAYIALALGLYQNFTLDDVKKGLSKKVINVSLRQGMYLYAVSLFPKEAKSITLSKQELLNFVQETRMLVLNTSRLAKGDFNFKALEVDLVNKSFEDAQALIHNSYLALCFSETVSAQKNYFELLRLYEKMSEGEKNKVYYEISKIYHYTKTVLSWI